MSRIEPINLAHAEWVYVSLDAGRQPEPIRVDPGTGKVYADLSYPMDVLSAAAGALMGPPEPQDLYLAALTPGLNIRHGADNRCYCPACPRRFQWSDQCIDHLLADHGLRFIFDVGFDNREWDLRAMLSPPLRSTVERVRGGRYLCPACDRTYLRRGHAITSHMRCDHQLRLADFPTGPRRRSLVGR